MIGILLPLAACGISDPDVIEQPVAASGALKTAEAPAEPQGQLVDYGFGQDGQYATGAAIVENTSDHGGQTVTVQMNFLDAAGEIITTAEQLESFAYAGQTIALRVFADLGNDRETVASVEPTLLVEDEGTFEESDVELAPIEASSITEQYGTYEAEFLITNPTADPLEDLRVGIVCRDEAATIIGGGVSYPSLVPPDGRALITESVTVSGEPAGCTAYPSPAGF